MALSVLVVASFCVAPRALARDVPVANATELRAAVTGAVPGDVILVADGTYELSGNVSWSACRPARLSCAMHVDLEQARCARRNFVFARTPTNTHAVMPPHSTVDRSAGHE